MFGQKFRVDVLKVAVPQEREQGSELTSTNHENQHLVKIFFLNTL